MIMFICIVLYLYGGWIYNCNIYFTDCLHLQLYRDSKDRYKQGQTKASLSLQHFLGAETGFTLDKESNTVAIICQDVIVVLAFDTRERLIQWQVCNDFYIHRILCTIFCINIILFFLLLFYILFPFLGKDSRSSWRGSTVSRFSIVCTIKSESDLWSSTNARSRWKILPHNWSPT